MRKAVFITAAFAVLGGGVSPAKAHFLYHKKRMTVSEKVNYFERSITHDTNTIQRLHRYLKYRSRKWYSRNFHYVARVRNQIKFHKNALVWDRHLLHHYRSKLVVYISPYSAICSVFGPYCSQALAVGRCESGLSTNATNGQYLGIFQMGDNERATYGHSSTALGQAQAAYRYFIASGRDWSPWDCKP